MKGRNFSFHLYFHAGWENDGLTGAESDILVFEEEIMHDRIIEEKESGSQHSRVSY